MLGTVIKSSDGSQVARVTASLEAIIRVGPDSELGAVRAFVDGLVGEDAGRLRGVCDNRDDFALRPSAPGALPELAAALGLACGATRDPAAADWTVAAYYDVATPCALPDVTAWCALGRRIPARGAYGIAVSLGLAEPGSWGRLYERAHALASTHPGLWRWITVGYRFSPLAYNGLQQAHFNIRRVAPRMRSADVGDSLGLHTSDWTTSLRTVSWATFVAEDLAERCGLDKRRPSSEVEVVRLPGGAACVRSPVEPGPGTSQRYVPRGLIEADRLLCPVRARDGIVFLPPWDDESTRDWLERWQTLHSSIGEGTGPPLPRPSPAEAERQAERGCASATHAWCV